MKCVLIREISRRFQHLSLSFSSYLSSLQPPTNTQNITHLHTAIYIYIYVRPVQYTVGSFIAKNSDAVPDGLEECLFMQSPLFKLFGEATSTNNSTTSTTTNSTPNGSLRSGGGSSSSKSSSSSSVCGTFMTQMNALGSLLESTTCSFVRCIKPNAEMKAGLFDPK
jgi:myosin V